MTCDYISHGNRGKISVETECRRLVEYWIPFEGEFEFFARVFPTESGDFE